MAARRAQGDPRTLANTERRVDAESVRGLGAIALVGLAVGLGQLKEIAETRPKR